jgi:hypothetical protein
MGCTADSDDKNVYVAVVQLLLESSLDIPISRFVLPEALVTNKLTAEKKKGIVPRRQMAHAGSLVFAVLFFFASAADFLGEI